MTWRDWAKLSCGIGIGQLHVHRWFPHSHLPFLFVYHPRREKRHNGKISVGSELLSPESPSPPDGTALEIGQTQTGRALPGMMWLRSGDDWCKEVDSCSSGIGPRPARRWGGRNDEYGIICGSVDIYVCINLFGWLAYSLEGWVPWLLDSGRWEDDLLFGRERSISFSLLRACVETRKKSQPRRMISGPFHVISSINLLSAEYYHYNLVVCQETYEPSQHTPIRIWKGS